MSIDSKKFKQLVNELETNSEITIKCGNEEIFIQSVDDKEGYSYVSSTNEEFRNSEEAVKWVVEKQ